MLRFCDSFDHYTTVLEKWTTQGESTISAGNGRFGAALAWDEWGGDFVTKTLDAQATWIIGMAIKFSVLPSAGQDAQVFRLLDGGTLQTDVRLRSTGKLYITRNGTQLGSDGATTLLVNTFYYLEFKCTINDTTGVAVLKVNGVTELNLSSQDTKNTANATADAIALGGSIGSSNFGTIYIDDVYVCDATGSAPTNDFLGDVRIETILPSGNGNSSQMDGSDGNSIDNYLLVDEAAPNSDTDYVESDVVGDKDTYVYGNVTPASGTVYGVQILPFAKKSDAGTRTFKSVARLSGTEADGPDTALTTSYQYHSDIRETKPGGGAWSISDVNSAEFGEKVQS